MALNANNGKGNNKIIVIIITINKQDLPLTIGLLHIKRNLVQNRIINKILITKGRPMFIKDLIGNGTSRIAKIKNLRNNFWLKQLNN